MNEDKDTVLLLGDIGVYAFREVFNKHSSRVINIGILEQSTIGTAAGMAMSGLKPIVYTIAPFLVERAYEQLKIDLGYQNLNVKLISVGASNDYSTLGPTHQCPADVAVLKQIPNMQIVTPGCDWEFNSLFTQTYNNGSPTYYRVVERTNEVANSVMFGKANIMKYGTNAIVIAVGNLLDTVMMAVDDLNVLVLYYTTLEPFDYAAIETQLGNTKIANVVIVEPYYSGALVHDIASRISIPARYKHIGIPHKFITNYGTYDEQMESFGLTVNNIHDEIKRFIT
jgi:transketolase